MSKVAVAGNASGSGVFTIASPNSNTDRTLTLPDQSGTLAFNPPAFSAFASSAQTVSSGTFTKITFGSEEFDTNSNFASSTFTPTIAGYYQINFTLTANGTTSSTRFIGEIRKNGTDLGRSFDLKVSSGTDPINSTAAKLVYMNGSSDYLEIYGYILGTGTLTFSSSGSNTSYFSGFLVRAA